MTHAEKSLCVYCGSSMGNNPLYQAAAKDLAHFLVQHKVHLIYGGASVGLMGVLADTVLSLGGKVTRVIPQAICDLEVAHPNLTRLYRVDSMHQRKQKMMDLADAFLALPGGIGTLEELFESLTWSQLKLHSKPCGLLNINGFYDELLRFLTHGVNSGFIKDEVYASLRVSQSPVELAAELLELKLGNITLV